MLKTRQEAVTELRRLADLANDESHTWTKEDEAQWRAADKACAAFQAEEDRAGSIGREDFVGESADLGDDIESWVGEHFRDVNSGRLVPVVRKNESFEKAVSAGSSSKRHEGLSVGRMIRAMATGANDEAESRALSEGLDSAGGYTVPDELSAQLIDRMRTKSRIFQAGTTAVPLTSDMNAYAKLLTDPTPGWRDEGALVPESDPTFGRIEFVPKTLACMVKVSVELLEDSLNIENAVTMALSQALANEVDRVALLGSGTSPEPLGLANMTGGVNEISMGTNGAEITNYTDLLDAIQALQEQNAGNTTAAIMAPRTLRTFSGLVDTTGQPLNRPKQIENLPFLETTQVPVDQTQGTATDASSIYLGDFSSLVVGFRRRLRIRMLDQRYAENLQVAFIAYLRCDIQAWHEQALARIVGITPTP